MGSKTLFNAVFINAEKLVSFYVCAVDINFILKVKSFSQNISVERLFFSENSSIFQYLNFCSF